TRQGSVRMPLVKARLLAAVLVIAFLVAACKATDAGRASIAEVRWLDAGGADVVLGTAAVHVPAGDLADGAKPSIVVAEVGNRFAYPTKSGEVRLLYKIGDGIYVGPKMAAPIDFVRAPRNDDGETLGTIFENAKEP